MTKLGVVIGFITLVVALSLIVFVVGQVEEHAPVLSSGGKFTPEEIEQGEKNFIRLVENGTPITILITTILLSYKYVKRKNKS